LFYCFFLIPDFVFDAMITKVFGKGYKKFEIFFEQNKKR